MSDIELAQFQEAAAHHIVSRLRDKKGSKRMLLADEVGLGKTVVAQAVIRALMKGRRRPLTVIYLCSNAEIAEQNRKKLDPDSKKPLGRVTELALERRDSADLLLYSFTPGTSINEGTGLSWERRLLLYLLYRIYGVPVGTKRWREFFRCGAKDSWDREATLAELSATFQRKTSTELQSELGAAWRTATVREQPVIQALNAMVSAFDAENPAARSRRNEVISKLRGVMQRVALRCLRPDLVILDEVQRFRNVIKAADDSTNIAADLFSRQVPVLILSATPYRALTLGHEKGEGAPDHYEDFFDTLRFLFDADKATPERIRRNLKQFGERLKNPEPAEQLDHGLLRLKRDLEADLTRVICRTERNWYVLDRLKGVEDAFVSGRVMPSKDELREFFVLHQSLSPMTGMGQVTEFWKSAPSLLTFLDSQYRLFRALTDGRVKVPRELVTAAESVKDLASRNHRISNVVDVALGGKEAPPRLWAAPTYPYYEDRYFGTARPRKVLVFSGWRFVPKTVAVVASRVAADRLGGEPEDASQPIRFTEKWSFHVFDICLPSPALAKIGHDAFVSARQRGRPQAEDVLQEAESILRSELTRAAVDVVATGGHRAWQCVMRLEQQYGRAKDIVSALDECVEADEDGSTEHLRRHVKLVEEWQRAARGPLQISDARLKRLALVAAFSPALSLLRACTSVYGDEPTLSALPDIAMLCLGPMRRYLNRPLVQQVIRQHRFRMPWRDLPSEDRGYAERTLIYSGDAHLQAVLDEYVYLLRNAGQADTLEKAVGQIGDIWKLSRGNPRTNQAKGHGDTVHIEENAETHSTHFALAFGEDIARDSGPDEDEAKLRKSVVREAFNSPFWPFVLATTSVGQEGLDFHLYCRDVLHWNLPSNPVDLEQREGRINRRDCLAVRESIANDWPLTRVLSNAGPLSDDRNPWLLVFDAIQKSDDLQKYKHGLFPHWVYECRDPKHTVRIRRHVPFFKTSRDAVKYERLKAGLALYRLVFGQVNQDDLLDTLQRQTEDLEPEARAARLKRLASYMLNLSPIGHQAAKRQAWKETNELLRASMDGKGLRELLRAVRGLQETNAADLEEARPAIDGLSQIVEDAMSSGDFRPARVRQAVAALAYLRNPYDHIFDMHVEGGFVDDIAVVRDAWASICVGSAGPF